MEILEKYVLDAESAFEEQNYLEGKTFLEDALTIEPAFGKAHNHLGWLYLYHLVDIEKSEMHLRLALKYAPLYKAPYIHMSELLFISHRFEELTQLLKEAEEIPGLSKSFLSNEWGRLEEVKGHYKKALKAYRDAIRWSLSDRDILVYEDNIRRTRKKKKMFLIANFLP